MPKICKVEVGRVVHITFRLSVTLFDASTIFGTTFEISYVLMLIPHEKLADTLFNSQDLSGL